MSSNLLPLLNIKNLRIANINDYFPNIIYNILGIVKLELPKKNCAKPVPKFKYQPNEPRFSLISTSCTLRYKNTFLIQKIP
jgi:hypothetical protein